MAGRRLEGTDKTGEPVDLRAVMRDELDDAHVERMLVVLQAGFDQWPAFDPGVPAAEHLRWKMGSPFSEVAALAAEIRGKLVGSITVMSLQSRIGGRLFSRGRFVDSVVHPNYRGRGIARTMAPLKNGLLPLPTYRQIESWNPALLHMAREDGAHPLGDRVLPLVLASADLSWRPADSITIASRLSDTMRVARGKWQRSRYRPPPHNRDVRQIDHFDPRFATLWEEAAEDFDLINVRTPQYLNWRYCDPRGGLSTIFCVVEADSVAGYVVSRVHSREGSIADILAAVDRPDVVDALLAQSVADLRSRGARRIVCWLPEHHPYRSVFLGHGFVSGTEEVPLRFRPGYLPEDAEALLVHRDLRFHYTLGDSDFV